MRLTIIAATGGVGRELLDQALSVGHQVTAVVRNPEKLTHEVPFTQADLAKADPTALLPALEGADAVLSALGARAKAEGGVATTGTRTIIEAMNTTGVRRIIAISSAITATVPSPGRPNPPSSDPGDGFFMRRLLSPLLKRALGWSYSDLATMEDLIRDSDTDWTIVRPTRLVNKPLTRTYRTATGQNLRHGMSVSRADVAHLMLNLIERPETIHQTIGIAK